MNDTGVVPFTPQTVAVKATSSRAYIQSGIVIPINKHAWISEGSVKPLEEGLPLVTDSTVGRALISVEEAAQLIEGDKARLLDTFGDKFESFEPELGEISQQIGHTPEELRFKRLHSKLVNKHRRTIDHPSTGIVKRPPAEDLIDTIGKVHLRTARKAKHVPTGADPFPPARHHEAMTKLPQPGATSALVKSKMKKVFRAGCEPFRDIDREEDFPIDGLFQPQMGRLGIDGELGEEPHKSILIDPSDRDIFWTKSKVPFTREEVEMIEGWRNQTRERMHRDDAKTKRLLVQRERAIERTFQSRLAFEKEVELTKKECKRVVNLPPGKGDKRKPSLWQVAAREAASDRSSLPYRKSLWNRLVRDVQQYGYLVNDAQKKLVMELRRLLLSGVYAGEQVFWQTMSVLEEPEFICSQTLVTVECMRRNIGVARKDLLAFFEERDICLEVYNLALDHIEIKDNEIAGKKYLIATSRNRETTKEQNAPKMRKRPTTAMVTIIRP